MRMYIATACLGVFLALGGAACAEPAKDAPATPPAKASEKSTAPSPEARLLQIRNHMMTRLKYELELTDEQAKKLGALMDAWHAQMKERRDAFHKDMKAVLTPEQQAAGEKARQEREARRAERHQKSTAPGAEARPSMPPPHLGEAAPPAHGFDLTVAQSKKMRSLAVRLRHLLAADKEMMLAEVSTLLSPLQMKAFETSLEQMATHAKETWEKARHTRTLKERTRKASPTGLETGSPEEVGDLAEPMP